MIWVGIAIGLAIGLIWGIDIGRERTNRHWVRQSELEYQANQVLKEIVG